MIRVAQIMGKMENGGVEAVVMNYYRQIDRRKIQFDFIVDNDSTCPQEQEILSLGGRVIRIAPYQKIIANMRDLKQIFQKNKYKIVHAELTTMSVFSLAVAKKCGVPVRICHGHNTACKGETKKNVMKYMLRLFSKTFATHYFACSDYAGKWLYGKNIGKSKRYKVIPNAINTEKYRFDPAISAEMRKSLGIEDKFVIGHIGRFVYQKNHDFLIDIFSEVHKQNDKAVLLLIGEGPLLEDVKAKVHRLGLDDFVIFLGVREDANRLYQAFDVFCLPSRYEGLGMVAIEAQISGLPIIVSNGIPGEAKITNRISYLNLNEKSETWAKKLIAFKFENRTDIEVKNDDYNISVQSRKMEEIYFRLIESEKLLLEGTLK